MPIGTNPLILEIKNITKRFGRIVAPKEFPLQKLGMASHPVGKEVEKLLGSGW